MWENIEAQMICFLCSVQKGVWGGRGGGRWESSNHMHKPSASIMELCHFLFSQLNSCHQQFCYSCVQRLMEPLILTFCRRQKKYAGSTTTTSLLLSIPNYTASFKKLAWSCIQCTCSVTDGIFVLQSFLLLLLICLFLKRSYTLICDRLLLHSVQSAKLS